MKFREFASLVQASAADVAQRIPTFDDLAAKDDYIHSEEFNVTGQTAKWKKKKDERRESGDISTKSSMSTYSGGSGFSQQQSRPSFAQENEREGSSTLARFPNRHDMASKSGEGQSNAYRPTAVPLLSVVVDTLENSSTQSVTSRLETETDSFSDMDRRKKGLNDDSSDDEDDDDHDEDPILSMIRKSKTKERNGGKQKCLENNNNKKCVAEKRHVELGGESDVEQPPPENRQKDVPMKNPYRFMDDLEKRLSNPERPNNQLDSASTLAGSNNHGENSWPPSTNKWGWMKHLASTKIDHILNRTTAGTASVEHNRRIPPTAPLSREKRLPSKQQKPSEEDSFQVSESTKVLGEDELAQLRKMKETHTILDTVKMLMDLIIRNHQFSFIGFTMALAAFVYFYTRHRSITDDVT